MFLPPRIALSALWFFFFGAFGCMFPYLSRYLAEEAGLSKPEVGHVFALMSLTVVLVQPLWGGFSDRTGSRRGVLRLMFLAGAAAFVNLGRARGFAEVLPATPILAVFAHPMVSQLTAACFSVLGADARKAYGPIRTWGTIGFLVGLRLINDVDALRIGGEGTGLFGGAPLFTVAAAFFVVGAAVTLMLPSFGDLGLKSRPGDTRRLLGLPGILGLLAFGFLANLAMQAPQAQLALVLAEKGGSYQGLSNTWTGMLLIEIPVVAMAGFIAGRVGPAGLVTLGLLAETLRWGITASSDSLVVAQSMQALHGFSVAGILIGLPMLIESKTPRELRSTAQAWLAAAGNGMGAMASNEAFGRLIDRHGSSLPLFLCAGLSFSLACYSIRRTRRRSELARPGSLRSPDA